MKIHTKKFYTPIELWANKFEKAMGDTDCSKFFDSEEDRMQKEIYFVNNIILRDTLNPDLQSHQKGAYNTMGMLTNKSRSSFDNYVRSYQALKQQSDDNPTKIMTLEEQDTVASQIEFIGLPGITSFLSLFSTAALGLREQMNAIFPLFDEEPRVTPKAQYDKPREHKDHNSKQKLITQTYNKSDNVKSPSKDTTRPSAKHNRVCDACGQNTHVAMKNKDINCAFLKNSTPGVNLDYETVTWKIARLMPTFRRSLTEVNTSFLT